MKLKNIAGFVAPRYKDPSVCESCGANFICGASLKGCWCMKVSLTERSRQELKQKFDNCLCPKCLDQFAEKDK